MTYVPLPSVACPNTGWCVYCRIYLRCSIHAGETPDWLAYWAATLDVRREQP